MVSLSNPWWVGLALSFDGEQDYTLLLLLSLEAWDFNSA